MTAEKRHGYWLLLLNKICVSNDEASVDHDERAVCIRKAAELAAKEGPDQVCFRGQALLCIARAMAKEEAEQALLALEESFHSILATARSWSKGAPNGSKDDVEQAAGSLVGKSTGGRNGPSFRRHMPPCAACRPSAGAFDVCSVAASVGAAPACRAEAKVRCFDPLPRTTCGDSSRPRRRSRRRF
ncbi:LCB2b [Symbiodinium sp. CCMP2592]|nr:LCB2b [Symbiodinium sp. CCMP2592]